MHTMQRPQKVSRQDAVELADLAILCSHCCTCQEGPMRSHGDLVHDFNDFGGQHEQDSKLTSAA